MNLKKTWFTSMAAITLASVGAAVTSANYHGDSVFASTTYRKLKRNAIIYTKNGKRTKKAHLKKGKKVTIFNQQKRQFVLTNYLKSYLFICLCVF